MLLQPYNEMNIYKRVEDRHARAVKVRHDFDKPREQIVEYFRPDLTDVVDNKGRLFESTNVYNGDPAYAGRVMTQGVFAGMCNPAQPWRRFKLPEKELSDDNDTRAWLQQLDRIMLGPVMLYVIEKETLTLQGKLTRYPIEDKDELSDHIYNEPRKIRLKVWVGAVYGGSLTGGLDLGGPAALHAALSILQREKVTVPYISTMAVWSDMVLTT